MSNVVNLAERRRPGWPTAWPQMAAGLREQFAGATGLEDALRACEPKLRKLWDILYADYNLGSVAIPNSVSREAAAEVAGVIDYALQLKGAEYSRRNGAVLYHVAVEYLDSELAKASGHAVDR